MRHHININTSLKDAQHDVVLSLLPRRHAVEIDGRHVAVGLLARLVDGPGCTPVRAYVDQVQEEDQEAGNPLDFVRCGRCLTPFDDTDQSWNGRAQYHGMPRCRKCTDLCHDTEIADHRCLICDPGPRNIPVRGRVNGAWTAVLFNRLEWEASRAAASR